MARADSRRRSPGLADTRAHDEKLAEGLRGTASPLRDEEERKPHCSSRCGKPPGRLDPALQTGPRNGLGGRAPTNCEADTCRRSNCDHDNHNPKRIPSAFLTGVAGSGAHPDEVPCVMGSALGAVKQGD